MHPSHGGLPKFLEATVAVAFADQRSEYEGTEPPSMDDRIVFRAPRGGAVEWIDILEGVNLHEALDEVSGLTSRIVLPNRNPDFDPRIEIAGKRIDLPQGTVIVRSDREMVAEGDIVAWKLAGEGLEARGDRG